MLHVLDHPLITHKLTQMRKKETKTKDFRQNLDEIGGLMAYEITRDLPTKEVGIDSRVCDWVKKYPKDMDRSIVMVVDPMLATGGSAAAAIDMVKKQGACDIRLICLVGAPEGVKVIEELHPDVDIYLAALDDHLNEKGYIVPGLGDAGDRIFGTK